ncbi:hypothetical protein ACHAWT_009251 [Skeletonema menzelii]
MMMNITTTTSRVLGAGAGGSHQGISSSRCLRRIRRLQELQRDGYYASLTHYSSSSSSSSRLLMHRCCGRTPISPSLAALTTSSSPNHRHHDHRQFHNTSIHPSDNLLGHSPMARSTPNTTTNNNNTVKKPISPFGVDSNTTGGGIWEQTSTKKTKLNELLTELTERGIDTGSRGMETLDDVAEGEERLDLDLVDGLKILVRIVDNGGVDVDGGESRIGQYENEVINVDIEQSAKLATLQVFKLFETTTTTTAEEEWTKEVFESKMNEAIRILSEGCGLTNHGVSDNKKKKREEPVAGSLDVSHPFCYLRQFVVSEANGDTNNNDDDDLDPTIQQQIQTYNNITQHALTSSTTLYRTLLLRATAQTLLNNWDHLTTITSGDIDRAAISKTVISSSEQQRTTVNADSIRNVLYAYAHDSPQEWVQSWWKLIDADGDGLIDQEEMNVCVDLSIEVVHLALGDMFNMSLEVCPVRTIGLGGEEEARKKNAWFLGVEQEDRDGGDVAIIPTNISPAKLSWRNRRKELKQRKILKKTFQGTIARHFRDQAEAPHRLRCIYAWAEKAHQDNKLDSVLVDASEDWGSGAASAVMGRKRYVELEPKISYPEFRQVQKKQFPHLDKIGEEIITSFKEDLWLLQGSKRQNKELRRDGLLFLLAISVVDLGIWMV